MREIKLKATVDAKDIDTLTKSINRLSVAADDATKSRIVSNLTSRAITEGIALIKQFVSSIEDLAVESIKLAANFQDTTNALAVFTGSTRLAKQELAEIDALAANTPGLRLQDAETGYQKLRALGFQADITKKLVAGLGNQKILSGADDSAVERVIVNLTQLRASSKDAARDLKESVKSLPSLNGVFQDAFGTTNTSKLRSLIQQDPKKFFDTLASGLANAERAEGGLNDASGKLLDAFTQLGRTGGEPILSPLTASIKDLTKFLIENASTFEDWGQTAADAIRGIAAAAKEASEFEAVKELASLIPSQGYGGVIGGALVNAGREKREKERQDAPYNRKDYELFAGRIGKDNTFDLSSGGRNTLLETTKEAAASAKAASDEKQHQVEASKQLELSTLKLVSSESKQILKDRNDQEQAIRDIATRHTAQQEIDFAIQSAKSKADYLNSDIAAQTGFFTKQIALNEGDSVAIEKLQSEKNKVLSGLNSELAIDSAHSQKQIQDLENRIYEERRQAAIEFGNLQIREVGESYDRQVFYIQRAISENIVSEKEGYEQEIQLAKANYTQTLALTKSQYEKQLENLSLTDEQRANILKEMYLTEQGLADKNARTILQIQDSIRANFIENLGIQRDALSSSLKDSASLVSSFYDNFFSPEAFSKARLNSFNELALQKTTQQNLKQDIGDSQAQGNVFRNLKTDLLRNNPSDTAADIGSNFNDEQLGQYNKFNELELNALKRAAQLKKQLKNVTDAIPDSYNKFADLANQINTKNVNAFDNLSAAILKSRQALDKADADSEVDYRKAVIAAGGLKGTELTKANNDLAKANRAQERLGYEQAKETVEQYANSVDGLRESLALLRAGDEQSKAGVLDVARKDFLRENIALEKENIVLQQKYYTDSDYLAQQDLNKRLGIEREIFELRQQIAEKGVFDKNESDAKVLDYLNSQIKDTSETFADFRIGIAGTFFDAIASPFDKLSKKLEGLNPIVKGLAQTFLNLAQDIMKAFSQKLILRLLGLDTGTTGATSSSGSSGGLFSGVSNIIKNLLGGSGSRNAATASGNSSAVSPSGLTADPYVQGVINGTIPYSDFGLGNGRGGGASSANVGGGGFLSSIQSLLPLAGIGLGSSVGGGSGAGGIFGSLGGGLLGSVGAAFGSSSTALGGAFGSIGGLLGISGAATLGIGAAIGGAVLLGSYLIGRNSRRNKEEKQRTEFLLSAFGDIKQFDSLIADVKSLKINPASAALTTGDTLGKSIHDHYIDAANQLKDKKTRNIALKDVSRVDTQIAEKMDSLKKAVAGAQDAEEFTNKFTATFATGGYMDGNFALQYKDFKRRNGFLTGGVSGADSLPSLLMPKEIVANEDQQERIRQMVGFDVFAHAGIPNYPNPRQSLPVKMAAGGFVGSQNVAVGSNSIQTSNPNQQAVFNGNIILQGFNPSPDAKAWLETNDGKRQVINIVREDIRNNPAKPNADGIARDLIKSGLKAG